MVLMPLMASVGLVAWLTIDVYAKYGDRADVWLCAAAYLSIHVVLLVHYMKLDHIEFILREINQQAYWIMARVERIETNTTTEKTS